MDIVKEFGVAMKIVTPGGDVVVELGDAVDDGHLRISGYGRSIARTVPRCDIGRQLHVSRKSQLSQTDMSVRVRGRSSQGLRPA